MYRYVKNNAFAGARHVVPLLALMIVACAESAPAPTTDPTLDAAAEPTASPQPALTSTPLKATALPPPTPIFPANQVAHSLVLSTGHSPDCELPCWHGLRVGESTQADVKRVFGEVLKSEVFDFSASLVEVPSRYQRIANTFTVGHSWQFPREQGGQGAYDLYGVFDNDTDQLIGIIDNMASYNTYPLPSLPEVVSSLGTPQWIYGGVSASAFQINMFYRQGIAVYTVIAVDNPIAATRIICFNSPPSSLALVAVDPFTSFEQESLSPLKQVWGAPDDPAPYIDPNIGTSIEDFIVFINSDNPCMGIGPLP
jgi:hypothetical protein